MQMRIRIRLLTLMRIQIVASKYWLKPLKKCSNRPHIPYILDYHLQTDADPDPVRDLAYHFDADPDAIRSVGI